MSNKSEDFRKGTISQVVAVESLAVLLPSSVNIAKPMYKYDLLKWSLSPESTKSMGED